MRAFFQPSTIALSLVVLIGFIILAIGERVYSGNIASLKFVNSTGLQIESAHIAVAGKSCSVKELGIDGEIQCHFENLHDSSYSVSVTLRGGAIYTEPSLGYVTHGMDFNDTITIDPSGVIKLASIPDT